ncbi:Zinc finger protein 142 [Oryzias melastigma]|uniref:Zinc finger protein 142 n=1 Tax=Oryzias melastigma TaxID=30732 RepID=A0A834FRJ6_ORYME|nr:Zinc finger protein 142 [Oryzias melastigma]
MELIENSCDKLSSQPRPQTQASSTSQGQLDTYKCSQCSEVFGKPTALKQHFKVNHREPHIKERLTCFEQGCQFSSSNHQEYQFHLTSMHGLNLIPCTSSSCTWAFPTREEMEGHRESHLPFGCFCCPFVAQTAKALRDHLNRLHDNSEGNQTESTQTPKGPKRSKRKLESSFVLYPNEEVLEREKSSKKLRITEEKEKSSAPDETPLPSKEYLAEGSENVYRTHTCPKCRRCFKMRSHLQEHLRLHFPDPSLQCPTCERFFTSSSKLRVHRRREAGEKSHCCNLCEYTAVERNAIRRHLASVHPNEAAKNHSFVCPSCDQTFNQARALKAHIKTHNIPTDSKPLDCFQESCSFQTYLSKELIKHTAEVHGVKAVECRNHACGAVFQSEGYMEAHYQKHLPYHCAECDFTCSNKTVFLRHRRDGHPGNKELCCGFCSFVTFNPVEFEHHRGHLHANEKIHHCSQCSYSTSHKRGLKRHMLMHSGEKPHKCTLCDFRCRDESYLSKHMLIHSDDKNFMCSECGYVTKWKHYLTVHMRKHEGDLRYSCDQCQYRCHRMDQLTSHKLRHQAKSLMCEICAYACKRKFELRNHMLAKHSAEEKQPTVHKCKYCAYSTLHRQALQNHENCKHTKLKEFQCALCVYSSFSSVSLFLHKKKAHRYVPGDKKWLEDYAAKEKERTSAELMQDFYTKPTLDLDQSEESSLMEPVSPSAPDRRESADHHSYWEGTPPPVDSGLVLHEQYCTLVLSPLTSTVSSSLANAEKNSDLNEIEPQPLQGNADFSTPASSSEEDDAAVQTVVCEQKELEDACECLNDARSPVKHTEPENNELQHSMHLKAMKQHDKDQAETMVLEGQVEMLVVQSENMYQCDKCSYGTCKETAFRHHCQTLCHKRIKAGGGQFKQRRGLHNHLKRLWPSHSHKTVLQDCQAVNEVSTEGHEEPEQIDGRRRSEEMQQKEIFIDLKSLKLYQQKQKASNSEAFASSVPQQQKISNQAKKVSNFKGLKGRSSFSLSNKSNYSKITYIENNGVFICKLCKFTSGTLMTVKQHILTHREMCKNTETSAEEVSEGDKLAPNHSKAEKNIDGPRMGQEFKCPNRRSQKKQLDSHGETSCMKVGEVQCTACSFVAPSKVSLTRHVLYSHKKKMFFAANLKRLRCQYCSFGCTRKGILERHVLLKHKCARLKTRKKPEPLRSGIGCYSCNRCDFSAHTPHGLRRHSRKCPTGDSQHVCTHCDAPFSSDIALRNHSKRSHSLQVSFSCKLCDFTCTRDGLLKAHQQSSHPRVKCTTCQKTFETEKSLEIHQRVHQTHGCRLCPFTAKTRQLLADHLLSEHEDGYPESKALKCSFCPFVCHHHLVLEQHLRSHGSKRLYKCTDCQYSTRNKQKITWHIRIHTGEKPYSCEQCTYTCADPSRLKLHMRVHQEEKKYLCPECGYKCKWATQLKYHMTKHTGEKPYSCDQCDYRTNRADALRAHRDTQHCDTRSYVCEECGKTFKTSFILKTHQRKHIAGRPYTVRHLPEDLPVACRAQASLPVSHQTAAVPLPPLLLQSEAKVPGG